MGGRLKPRKEEKKEQRKKLPTNNVPVSKASITANHG